MKETINIYEARDLLNKYIKDEALLNHSRETEVVMRALARYFNEDEELWGITGLLHDLDMEEIKGDNSQHGKLTCEILQNEGFDIPVMFSAIKSHVESLGFVGVPRETRFEYCLSAGENITGLIVAYALMRPEKLDGMKASGLNKRFKSKAFAAGVNRDMINDIEKTGLEKNKFFEISIDAIQKVAKEIGF